MRVTGELVEGPRLDPRDPDTWPYSTFGEGVYWRCQRAGKPDRYVLLGLGTDVSIVDPSCRMSTVEVIENPELVDRDHARDWLGLDAVHALALEG